MTLKEITDVASVLIGKQVDTALANLYVTEGINLITTRYSTACPIKCITITCNNPKDPKYLPNNRGIYKIYRNKQLYADYRMDETGLFFSHEGEYTVYYYSAFFGKLSEAEPVPVSAEYEAELCKYVAFSVLRADDPSNRLADKLVEEFYDNCAAINQSILGRLRRKPLPILAPKWR